MSARASKHPKQRFDRSNDSTRALAGKDPSTGAKEDTASARFRLDRGIKSTVDDRTREFRRRCRRRSPRRVRRPGVASIFFEVISIARVARNDRERWFHAWRASRGSGNARVSLGGARRVPANVARRFRFPSTRASVRAPRVSSCYIGAPVTQLSRGPVFSASVTTRLRGFVGPCKRQYSAQPWKSPGTESFLARSVTPDFARVLIETPRHRLKTEPFSGEIDRGTIGETPTGAPNDLAVTPG